jgi:hypothetical protein
VAQYLMASALTDCGSPWSGTGYWHLARGDNAGAGKGPDGVAPQRGGPTGERVGVICP